MGFSLIDGLADRRRLPPVPCSAGRQLLDHPSGHNLLPSIEASGAGHEAPAAQKDRCQKQGAVRGHGCCFSQPFSYWRWHQE